MSRRTKLLRAMTVFIATAFVFVASFALADVPVRGHYRSDGTYVQPHHRSDPDGRFDNNWSTEGNVNPHTGKHGTKHAPRR